MRKIILAAGVLVSAMSAQAAEYIFTNDNGYAHVAANWDPSPVWNASAVGVINDGYTMLHAYLANGSLGSGGNWATLQINSGGTVIVPNANTASVLENHFTLNGGTLDLQATGAFNMNSRLHITAPSTLWTRTTQSSRLQSKLSGSGDLTIKSTGYGGATPGENFRLTDMSLNSDFSGNIYLEGPLFLGDSAVNALGTATVTVREGGGLYFGVAPTNAIVLAGGSLRVQTTVSSFAIRGPVTLEADSYLDTNMPANQPLVIQSDITGDYDIHVGVQPPRGAPANEGYARFTGNNAGWTGGLFVQSKNPANPYFTRFGFPHSLPGGAITALNAMRLRLEQNADWTLTNSIRGPVEISMRNDLTASAPAAQLLTLAGNTVAPAGTMSVFGRLCLTNSTLRVNLPSPGAVDAIAVNASAGPAITLTNVTLAATCDYDGGSLSPPAVIIQNNSAFAVSGIFKNADGFDLPEDATVDLGNGRFAKITYKHTHNGNATSVALHSFRTLSDHVPPGVGLNGGASAVYARLATINGIVTNGTPAPFAYFCWGGEDFGDISTNGWNVIPMGLQSDAFAETLCDLEPDTPYWYRCYAFNEDGDGATHTAWSEPCAFTTAATRVMWWTRTTPVLPYSLDNTDWAWNLPHWDNAIPATSGDTGYVTNRMHAVVQNDLGAPGNRPTIIVTEGGTLFNRTDPPVTDTPIVLAGGTFDLNYRSGTKVNYPVRVVSDSLLKSNFTTHPSDFEISKLIVEPDATLRTSGYLSFDGNNPGIQGTLRFGAGLIGMTGPLSFGSAKSLHLETGVILSQGNAYEGKPLNISHPVRGFGTLHSCVSVFNQNTTGVTLSDTVMPGDSGTFGVLTVNSRWLNFTAASTLVINIRNADDSGELRVINVPYSGTDDPDNVTVNIAPGASLELNIAPNAKAYPGDEFVILRNTGTGPTTGEFDSYPENTKIYFPQASGTLTYKHDGNSVAITDIRPGGTLLIIK
ncbi:MAG: hypothetical protein FWG05_00730 [Kiritimatiellaeota bacterium]|nr:hypothetical protein [Kiritimatiellota bacterium]